MKKNIKLSRLKIRWLNTKGLILMLFGFLFLSWGGNAQTTVTIGTGTGSNGASASPAVFANYYYGNKIQILYEASELLTGGATANSYINSVAFDVDNLNSVPTLVNFTVKVYTTSETNPLGTTAFFDGVNTTNSIGSYTVAATGWNTLTLTNPILWNGCDNIVVEVCSNDNNWTSSGNASTKYSSVSGSNTYVRWYRADNTTVCPATTGPDTSTNRPNIQFSLAANTANCGYVCDFEAVAQSATTVDLSWAGTGVSYEIEYGLEGFTPGTGTTITTTNLTQTLSTLSASTTYDFYIEQICSSGPSAGTYGPVKVTTPCGIVSNNFSENFDTTATGSSSNATIPDCWSYIDDVTSTGYGYTIASTPLSSPNTFRLYRTNSTTNSTQELVLVSPETNNLGNGTPKQLRFYMRSYSTTTTYDNKLEILSMPSATSTAGATVLATITNTGVTGQNWQEYIVPLPTNTTDDYFGFRLAYNGTTATSSVVLDDIYLENLETCMYPIDLTVSNVTQTGADISWTPSPQSQGGTGYEYEIRTSGAPGSGTTGLVATATTTNLSVTLSTLNPNTDYEVYVRSLCGIATSRWSQALMFKTLCGTFGDFYENFDSLATGSSTNPSIPDCWTYFDDVASTGYGYTSSSYPQSGSRSFRFYRTNSTTNAAENIILISPPTDNLGNGGKQVRFSARSESASASYVNSKIDVVRLSDNTGTGTVTVLDSFVINTGTVYQEYVVPLPVTTDDYFGFQLSHNGTTNVSYVYRSEVYYEDVPAPTIDAIIFVDNACFGEINGSATVVVEGGALPLTYEWLPSGGSLSTADSLAAGIYTITVTDALNRSVTDTVTISSPDEILMDFTYENISCNGQADGSASVSPSGGVGPYLVLWSTNDTTDTISNLTAGSYSVTITDSAGCSVTEDFDIVEPNVLTASVSAQSDVTSPGGNDGSATITVTGGTAPYSYSWSPSGGTSDTATGLTAGTYTVNITDDSGCTTHVTVVITEPIPLTITLVSQTDVSCNGGNDGEIIIDVIGDHPPFTYSWTPSVGSSATISNLAAGTYTVVVTDTLSGSETATYTIAEPVALSPSIGSITHVSCNSGNNGSATVAVLGGTAPYTYSWSSGETSATAVNLSAGNNFVVVTDAN